MEIYHRMAGVWLLMASAIVSNNNNDVWGFTAFFPLPSSRRCRNLSIFTTSASLSRRQMFTGIVEEMGKVIELVERTDLPLWDGSLGKGTELTVQGDIVMSGAYLGCSISVNGVCLTATELMEDEHQFKVGLSPETLRCTYLSSLKAGDLVNLERASEIGNRNSGHFVQGHIDEVGTILDRWVEDDSIFFKIGVSTDLIRYIVPKGFIAIDGTSLTVCNVNTSSNNDTRQCCWFTFMLVQYTQQKIITADKQIGELVKIEVDVLGKYSESALSAFVPRIEELEAKVKDLEEKLIDLKK